MFRLAAQRQGDAAPYLVEVTSDDDFVYWNVTSTDTAKDGIGRCELQYYIGDVIAKSQVWLTRVLTSLEDAGETPEPYETWVSRVLSASAQARTDAGRAAEAMEAAEIAASHCTESASCAAESAAAALSQRSAIENLTVEAATLDADVTATVNKTVDAQGAVTLRFGIPRGEKGETGETGPQGPQGERGQTGATGSQGEKGNIGAAGPAGADATINGVNSLTIAGSSTVEALQSGSTLTLRAKGWSNPNLLDNWYFGNPDAIVDQRGGYVVPYGVTYYSDAALTTSVGTTDADITATYVNTAYGTITVRGTTYYVAYADIVRGYTGTGYGIDRWFTTGGTHSQIVNADSVTIKVVQMYGGILQYLEEPCLIEGQNTTLSILTENGCFQWTFSPSKSVGRQSSEGWFGVEKMYSYVDFYRNDSWRIFVFDSADNTKKSVDVKAVKLELGNTQTLAHYDETAQKWVLNDPPPNYQQELAKCQRYYQLYATQSLRPSNAADCRPVMRTTPAQGTIVIDGTTYYYNDANL